MKRLTALLLTAALLLSPVLATGAVERDPSDTPQAGGAVVHGAIPFTDVAEDAWYADAVALCYETGLFKGRTQTSFDPQGSLTAAELTVLSARLYSVCSGSGIISDLPDLTQPYLRFYDEDGTLLRAYTLTEPFTYNAGGESLFISLSDTPDDPALPEHCTLTVGFDDYTVLRHYTGTRESYTPAGGLMNQGLSGTGYRIADPEAASLLCLSSLGADQALVRRQNAWWFPAVFYLSSQGLLNVSGDLIYRLDPSGQNREDYDPLFSRNASRALAAWLIDLTAGELPALNSTTAILDVDPEETEDTGAILRLYQAGVLTGADGAGRFEGSGVLTRAQMAVILARVLDPALRVTAQGS